MTNKNMIIASTSTLYDGKYLEYLQPELIKLFANAETILFIPFARPSGITHDEYTEKVAQSFQEIGKKVIGIHSFENKKEALQKAKAIFIGGGNTFLLVQQMYFFDLFNELEIAINKGIPYLGTSAGSNITGLSMQTTNDMPIVYPPSFKTLGAISFNLNPHYLDPLPDSQHMGETRETRIGEFHKFNNIPVLGLREGSWLEVKAEKITLRGNLSARLFEANKAAVEITTNTDLSLLGKLI